MRTAQLNRFRLAGAATAAAFLWLTPPAKAQQSFNDPEAAASALASAVKSGNRQDLLNVLGANGEDIIDSGDEFADKAAREQFLAAYDGGHSVKVDGKKASLIIGPDGFPFPIPLTHTRAGWEFDTDEGRQ